MLIEDLEVHLLSDGYVRADAGGPFGLVPRALYSQYFVPDENNTVPEGLTSLLVRSRGKWILVDNGLGDKLTEKEARNWGLTRPAGGLLEALDRLGIEPGQIDVVINTHLHSDHVGGNTRWENGEPVAAFPRADYYVQRMEWADASFPDVRTRGTYFAWNFAPLLTQGRLKLLHGDFAITDQVRCVVTPGHTRGHQSVLLQAGPWRGLFLGDLASHAVHMERTAWLTSFDVFPLENLATKQHWQRWALETGAWLFFEHEPKSIVARLVEEDGRLKTQIIPEAQLLIDSLPIPPPPPE